LRTIQLLPRAQILQICVLCVIISNALYSTLSTPKTMFWAGPDSSCLDPCTRCSAQAHSAFRLPSDPGPQALYNGARVPILDTNKDPELDATSNPTYVPLPALDRTTQVTINADFELRRKYWLLYLNIKRACYNVLDKTIDDAFKFSPDPNLTGWNPSMEIIDI